MWWARWREMRMQLWRKAPLGSINLYLPNPEAETCLVSVWSEPRSPAVFRVHGAAPFRQPRMRHILRSSKNSVWPRYPPSPNSALKKYIGPPPQYSPFSPTNGNTKTALCTLARLGQWRLVPLSIGYIDIVKPQRLGSTSFCL